MVEGFAEKVVAPPVAAPPVEAAKPPVEDKKPVEDLKIGDRFATLARRERMLVEKQEMAKNALAQEKAALQKEKEEILAHRKEAESWGQKRASAKTDPASFLKDLYGDNWYEQLTEYQLSDAKKVPADMRVAGMRDEIQTEIQKLREEQAAFRREQEAERQKYLETEQERAEQERQVAIERFERETVDFVKGNASKYELTSLFDRADLVSKTIKEVYEATAKTGQPRVMTYAEAAEEVEKYLTDYTSKYDKWKEGKGAKPAAPPTTAAAPNEVPSPAPTLSHSMTASSGSPTPPLRKNTEQDRIKRALEAWEKNQTVRPG